MPVKRKVVSRRKRIAVRKSNSLSFFAFLKKNFLLIAILVLMPVTILALSNDNLSNLSSAAGRFGKFFTQGGQIRTLGGTANDGKNCEGKCYDPSLPNECLSAGIGRNSQGKCYNCSVPITFETVADGSRAFTADTNRYDYNESYCTPHVTPTPAPSDAPIQSIVVSGGCNKCVWHYDFPPYDPTVGGKDYNGSDFYDSDCQKAIDTKSGCTNNNPAPKDTYPTARPQATSAPEPTRPNQSNCGNWSAFCVDSANYGSDWECIPNGEVCKNSKTYKMVCRRKC